MDTLLSTPGAATASTTPPPVSPSNPSPQATAAATVTPDPVTAEILRKHTAGEKLTAREGGLLGVWKRKLKGAVGMGTPERPRENPFAPTAVPIRVGTIPPSETPDLGLNPVDVDAGFARRTAIVGLNKCDTVTKAWLTRKARAAGAEGNELSDLVAAGGFSGDDKQLLGDLAPDICAELGINPRKSPLIVAGAIVAAHATSIALAVMRLNELTEKKVVADKKRERDLAEMRELERRARDREVAEAKATAATSVAAPVAEGDAPLVPGNATNMPA